MDGLDATADLSQEPGGAKFDLLLDLAEGHRRRIRGSLAYNPALFTRATAEQLAAGFLAVVEQFAADPGITLDRLRIQSPSSTARAWSRASAGDPTVPRAGPWSTPSGPPRPGSRRVGAHGRRRDGTGASFGRSTAGSGPRQGADGLRCGARRPGCRRPAPHGRRRCCSPGCPGRGRRLHPGGPHLPGGADRHDPRGRRARRGDPGAPAAGRRTATEGSADRSTSSTLLAAGRGISDAALASAARPPVTWPTCSTRPVPPAAPRAWPCRIAPWPTCTATTTAPCTPRGSRPPEGRHRVRGAHRRPGFRRRLGSDAVAGCRRGAPYRGG